MDLIDKEWSLIDGIDELTKKNIEIDTLHNNSLILSIKQILWNEIELNDIEWIEYMVYIICMLYKKELILKQEFVVILSKLLTKDYISLNDLPLINYIISKPTSKDKKISIENWLHLLIKFSSNITSDTISLKSAIDFYKEYYSDSIENIWNHYITCVESINGYPEYIEDTLNNTDDSELIAVLPWVKITQKRFIIDHLLKKFVKDLPNPITEENFNQNASESNIFKEFPSSFHVLESRINDIPVEAIKPEIFNNVPQELIKDIAPKFAYSVSNPETDPKIRIFFPGGEGIGHSAILIKSKFGLLLFDFGMSVVNNVVPQYFPLIDRVDALFLSHAHLDHSGAVPLLLRENRTLPVLGTSATKHLCSMLWHDSSNLISNKFISKNSKKLKKDSILHQIANPFNVDNALNNFQEIRSKVPVKILPHTEVTSFEASHLFGSVGFEINIAGKRLFYTGDFNLDGSAIFPKVEFPYSDADSVIFDGTYYGRNQEDDLNISVGSTLKEILARSKRILIPAFSMGRSQEMLYNLYKIQAQNDWKIFATGMGSKVATMMKLNHSNIKLASSVTEDQFTEKTIVIAGQGMLQAGLSRKLFEYSKEDPNTGVIICGYQAPGTMGYNLLDKSPYLTNKYQQEVHKIIVSGHTNGRQLDTFIDNISGKKIMVHAPEGSYDEKKRNNVLTPANQESNSL
ncbi:MAG: Ribonuclease [Candidatus Heimdallarchaeota archaeon LC_3]|nr:MAG: Ribonuclease [Candidatus Heimdallarchaeota archaeon LC_3]